MSTIKPLDIYVGDVKVFPDVDLSGVGNPITETDTFEEMTAWYNMESREKACDAQALYANEYGWTRYVTPMLMPVVEESDDSPWHTEGTWQSRFWDFREMGTLYEVPFAIDPKWLRNDRYGSQAFIMCDKLKTLSFDPNKPVAPFIMKDDQGNVVLKTEANLGALFARCGHLRSITGLVINDIQDFTYDTSYIQTGATVYLYYDDHNVNAGQTEGVDADSFNIDTYAAMFQECAYLTTLDVTFPSVMHTNDIGSMFFYCLYLPDDQFPTLNLAPLNPLRNISISQSFRQCNQLEHVPITEASWQYIDNAESAFSDTSVHTIDIPANATHLNNIHEIMNYHWNESAPDTLIVRTESLMTKYKNGEIDAGNLLAFNPADIYSDDPDWQLYFHMYVPDSQYSDWVDLFDNLTNTERGQGTWFSDNYLHPVSEYVEPQN